MKQCGCGKFTDSEHATRRRCRMAGVRVKQPSHWAQEPEGFLTLTPILDRYGIHYASIVFRCEMRTVQRMARRTYTIPQARAMADLFGVRVKELWPELAEIDQQLGAVEWRERAACKGRDQRLFFTPALEDQAKACCNGCAVRDDCLTETLFIEEKAGTLPLWGVAGGLAPSERAPLLRFREDATRRRVGGAA